MPRTRCLSRCATNPCDALERVLPAVAHLLDLGCGPGTDAEHLAANGYRVTAIDWSRGDGRRGAPPSRRTPACTIASTSSTSGSINDTSSDTVVDRFDAAYSNFGPLNCVDDLPRGPRNRRSAAARRLPGRVGDRPRLPVGDRALHVARRSGRARDSLPPRRPVPVPLEGRTVWTRYYTPRPSHGSSRRSASSLVSLRALGLFAPPPYLERVRRPPPASGRRRCSASRIEPAAGRACARWGDHFLIVLAREA